jgi:hypothetical protein
VLRAIMAGVVVGAVLRVILRSSVGSLLAAAGGLLVLYWALRR